MRTTGFDEQRFVPVDIRGTDNAGIEQRLKEAVEGILKRADASTSCSRRTRKRYRYIERQDTKIVAGDKIEVYQL